MEKVFISFQISATVKFRPFGAPSKRHFTSCPCFSNTDGKEPRRREKGKEDHLHASLSQAASYFEIPTKEGHMANNGIHEIPTKDTEGSVATSAGKIYIPATLVYYRDGGGTLGSNFRNFKIYNRFDLDALYK